MMGNAVLEAVGYNQVMMGYLGKYLQSSADNGEWRIFPAQVYPERVFRVNPLFTNDVLNVPALHR